MNLHWLLPKQKGIPVLMYHRIWPEVRDRITQTPEQLEEQLAYLKDNGYDGISFQEYLEIARGDKKNDGKKVLITFDDGYQNNLIYAYPMLQRFGFKATFFIIGDTLEKKHAEGDGLTRLMTAGELRSINPSVVQLAMHGFHHEHFKLTPLAEVKEAIQHTQEAFKKMQIPLEPAIAYPYGGRPKRKDDFDDLKAWMRLQGVAAAFRIGNAVSEMPANDMYEIKRIDIRGTDTLADFRIKLQKGKLRPF